MKYHFDMLQPKMRFLEFNTEWFERKLSELLIFKNGINASKEDYGSGYKFINVLDIINNDFITHDRIIGSVQIEESVFNKNIVEYGDVLFQRSSETREDVGQANVYLDKNLPATFGGFVIRGKKLKDYDPVFMNTILKTSRTRKEITSKSGGSTRYNVGQDTLGQVSIYIPELCEQQKIASFLSTVEEKNNLLKKQLSLLEQYRKGVMQKIFSREIRFKDEDGKSFPEWEEKKFGDFIQQKNTRNKENKNLLVLSISNTQGFILQSEQFENHRVASKNTSNYKIVEKGDVAYNPSRINVGSIAILKNQLLGIVSPMYTVFRLNQKLIKSSFFETLISTHKFSQLVKKSCSGSVRESLNFDDLALFEFEIPSLKEQQKISSFLSSIDDKIEKNKEQIRKMELWKKGLLQQMFI